MNTKPIKTEKEYEDALKRLDEIFDAPIGTPESDEAEILEQLISDYEDIHYPIDPPDSDISEDKDSRSSTDLKNYLNKMRENSDISPSLEEIQNIVEEVRSERTPKRTFGSAKGKIKMHKNFDEPLEDFKDI